MKAVRNSLLLRLHICRLARLLSVGFYLSGTFELNVVDWLGLHISTYISTGSLLA